MTCGSVVILRIGHPEKPANECAQSLLKSLKFLLALVSMSVEIEPIAVTDCGSNLLASHGHSRVLPDSG